MVKSASGMDDGGSLALWLARQPLKVKKVLCARALMRVAPFSGLGGLLHDTDDVGPLAGLKFASALMLNSVGKLGDRETEVHLEACIAEGRRIPAKNLGGQFLEIAYAAVAANPVECHDYSVRIARYAAGRLVADEHDAVEKASKSTSTAFAEDLRALSDPTSALSHTFHMPLWGGHFPNGISNAADEIKRRVDRAGVSGELWSSWYFDRVRGESVDWELERGRLLIPDEVWNQVPKVLNAEIARLIAERVHFQLPIIPSTQELNRRARDGIAIGARAEEIEPAIARMREAAAAFLNQLDENDPQIAHGGMGHNQPPPGQRLAAEIRLPATEAVEEIIVEVTKAKPDVVAVALSAIRLRHAVYAGLAAVSAGFLQGAGNDLWAATADGTLWRKAGHLLAAILDWINLSRPPRF